jgi:hypothetical protein
MSNADAMTLKPGDTIRIRRTGAVRIVTTVIADVDGRVWISAHGTRGRPVDPKSADRI